MYAIVEIGGKQYRVAKDMKIKVPHQQGDTGTRVDFDRVIMVEDDKGNVTIGTPLVAGTNVSATIIEHGREKKIIVFKKKRRKGYQKKNGHRQGFSLIEITGIGAAKKAPAKKAATAAEKPAEKTAKAETKPVKKTAAKAKSAAEPKTATNTATKPAKKAPAKKTTAVKTESSEKKTAAKSTAAKKPAAKKTAKPAAGTTKKDVKED